MKKNIEYQTWVKCFPHDGNAIFFNFASTYICLKKIT